MGCEVSASCGYAVASAASCDTAGRHIRVRHWPGVLGLLITLVWPATPGAATSPSNMLPNTVASGCLLIAPPLSSGEPASCPGAGIRLRLSASLPTHPRLLTQHVSDPYPPRWQRGFRPARAALVLRNSNSIHKVTRQISRAADVPSATPDYLEEESATLRYARIVGKVFHDRDLDGWQDDALASDLVLSGGPLARAVLVGDLPGRQASPTDTSNQLEVPLPSNWNKNEIMTLISREGSVLNIHADGHVEFRHKGAVKAGRSSQKLEIDLVAPEQSRPIFGQQVRAIRIRNVGRDESGLPGVRLIDVNGLVIQTDRNGQYHIEIERYVDEHVGGNYVLKVDPASLPGGATFTTPNPHVERLSQGLASAISFGVALAERASDEPAAGPKVVRETVLRQREILTTTTTEVTRVHFDTGGSLIREADFERLYAQLSPYRQARNLTARFIGHTDNRPMSERTAQLYGTNQRLSEARARQVADVAKLALGLSEDMVQVLGMADRQPLVSNDSPDGMATNRRVEMELTYDAVQYEPVEEVVERLIHPALAPPGAGAIQLALDPGTIRPHLAGLALRDFVAASDGAVAMLLYSNYPAFIDHINVRLHGPHDAALSRPLASAQWRPRHGLDTLGQANLILPGDLAAGQSYRYVVEAVGKDGETDRTHPRQIQVLEAEQLSGEAEARTYAAVAGQNFLTTQSIELRGARVRVSGRGVNEGYKLSIQQRPVALDSSGAFAIDAHLPPGNHEFALAGTARDGREFAHPLVAEVAEDYFFMVGVGSLTFGAHDIDELLEPLPHEEQAADGSFTNGRLGFYLKGRIRGKYLLTARLDTSDGDISKLGQRLTDEDPSAVFRRLDPDLYYPVYGDDGRVLEDAASQSGLYVRLDWDQSRALLGNFHTGLTGSEFAQYSRSLHGAQLAWRTPGNNRFDAPRVQVDAFVADAQTHPGRVEFRATGGSLYYLNRTDVVQGSEKLRIEVRRRGTQQVSENLPLVAGEDYQFDPFQGRIILSRPLALVSAGRFDPIIREVPLEGDEVYLVADFEYRDAVAPAASAAGVQARMQISDSIGVGASVVSESRGGSSEDYQLLGADVELQFAPGSYLRLELASSEGRQADSVQSLDGGLGFAALRPLDSPGKGDAFGLEARLDLGDAGSALMWHKDRDAGFSSSRDIAVTGDTTDTGMEALLRPAQRVQLLARGNVRQHGQDQEDTSATLRGEWQASERLSLALEGRLEQRDDPARGPPMDATQLGARFSYALNRSSVVYAQAQSVVDEHADYPSNDLFTLGMDTRLSDRTGVTLEISEGDRGTAMTGGLAYQFTDNVAVDVSGGVGDGAYGQAGARVNLDNGYQLYGSYGADPERSLGQSRRVTTLGQRMKLANGIMLFNEHQWGHNAGPGASSDSIGMDVPLGQSMQLSMSLQNADFDVAGVATRRDAATLGLSARRDGLRFGSVVEYRRDETPDARYAQWVTTNIFEYRSARGWQLGGRLNLSETDDEATGDRVGRAAEASLGGAWRPTGNDQWRLLGRLTYLFDQLAPNQQMDRPDRRAQVGVIESLYDINSRWGVDLKLAARRGEKRFRRNPGVWQDDAADLAVVRGRVSLGPWEGQAEYRWLDDVVSQSNRQGWLLAAYRQVGDHLRVGGGYNFSKFSADLASHEYHQAGWFVDLVGSY